MQWYRVNGISRSTSFPPCSAMMPTERRSPSRRACRFWARFGVANELYAYEQNWVEMDGDGKYAKPVEDPQTAYVRRYGKPGVVQVQTNGAEPVTAPMPSSMLTDMEIVSCPKCGGRMWDNRLTKRNPRAPDYKCQNRSCDGVIWPPKVAAATADAGTREQKQATATDSVLIGSEEELPF